MFKSWVGIEKKKIAFVTESGLPHEYVSTEQHLTCEDWATTFLSIQMSTENTFHPPSRDLTLCYHPEQPTSITYLPDHPPPLCICQDLIPAYLLDSPRTPLFSQLHVLAHFLLYQLCH